MQKDFGNAKAYINLEIDEFDKMMDYMENALTSNIEVFFGGASTVNNANVTAKALKDSDYMGIDNGLLVKVVKSDTQESPFSFVLPAKFVRALINAAMGGDQSNQNMEFDDFDLSTSGEILGQAMNTFGSAISLEYGKPIAAYSCEVSVLSNYAVLLSQLKLEGDETILQTQFDLGIDGFDTYKCLAYANISILKAFVLAVGRQKVVEVVPPTPVYAAPTSAPAQEVQPTTSNTLSGETIGIFREPISKASMELLMNIPLEISIQIGQTKRKIKDICDFTNGTVIELERPISEPIEILANERLIAHGEVVVLGDNFGIKITDVLDMKEILSDLDNLFK